MRIAIVAALAVFGVACGPSDDKACEDDCESESSPTSDSDVSEASDPDSGDANRPPTAVIGGPSQATLFEETYLFGHLSSDPDGDTLLYAWKVLETPDDSTLSLTDTGLTEEHRLDLQLDAEGTFTFGLTVSDGRLTDSTSAAVEVAASASESARL